MHLAHVPKHNSHDGESSTRPWCCMMCGNGCYEEGEGWEASASCERDENTVVLNRGRKHVRVGGKQFTTAATVQLGEQGLSHSTRTRVLPRAGQVCAHMVGTEQERREYTVASLLNHDPRARVC